MISTQFLQNCQAGDEEAIETLVRTHQRGVFQLALSVLDDAPVEAGPPASAELPSYGETRASSSYARVALSIADAAAEAETATRETFIAALGRLGRYREDTPFATWLYAVTIDVSRRRARRWKMRQWSWQTFGRHLEPIWRAVIRRPREPIALPTPDPHYFLPGDLEMWASVRSLNEKLRIPVVLRYYHDFPINEIAHLLHLSEGAVHARLEAAREKIAINLEK